MDNFKQESEQRLSFAADFLRKSTEEAIVEAIEDQFELFLEYCSHGEVPANIPGLSTTNLSRNILIWVSVPEME